MTRLLSLILLALLALCSCSKPGTPAANVALSPAEAQALSDGFARLDKVLAAKAVSIQTNLSPPAKDEEIAALRAALGGKKIDVLEAWFRWHNGGKDLRHDLLPLGRPMSVADSLEDRKSLQTIPFVGKLRKSSVKILDDGAGDGFFLDPTAAKPVVFYQMLEDPTPRVYGTMTEFVNFLASGFESGVLSTNAAGELAYDGKKYQALEAAHFRSLKRN